MSRRFVSPIYCLIGFALNPVNKVFRVAGNVVSDRSSFADEREYVRGKPVSYVGARRTVAAALKRASGVWCFVKGCVVWLVQEKCRGCCCVWKATLFADLNML